MTAPATPCLDKAAVEILNSEEIYAALLELRALDPCGSRYGFLVSGYRLDGHISVEMTVFDRPSRRFHDTIEAALVWQHKQLLEIIAEIEAGV